MRLENNGIIVSRHFERIIRVYYFLALLLCCSVARDDRNSRVEARALHYITSKFKSRTLKLGSDSIMIV